MTSRHFIYSTALYLTLTSFHQDREAISSIQAAPAPEVSETEINYSHSVVRINATQQKWSMNQPWDKLRSYSRSALGVVIGKNRILTTAEMGSNVVSIELSDTHRIETVPAKIVAVDYGANLAILETDLEEGEDSFVSALKPVEIATPLKIGEQLSLVQVEENGMALRSQGQLQGVDMLSTYAPGEHLLCYVAKVSLQSATSSYSIPAFSGNKLLGLLSSYDSEDQISTIISTETVSSFLKDVGDGEYNGFPTLGIAAFSLTDPNLRNYLELSKNTGGIYVSRVKKGSPADKAGLLKGDVITSAAGYALDVRGYYEDELYGRMYWTHIVSGKTAVGDDLAMKVQRNGKEIEVTAKLMSRGSVRNPVPHHLIDRAPDYLVKGGLIFQELSRPFLKKFGKDWKNKAPLELLNILSNPDDVSDEKESIIILSAVIPTKASLGYERMRNAIIEKINGIEINSMKDLEAALSQKVEKHSIVTNGTPHEIFLDAVLCDSVDTQLLQRGLPQLKRIVD